jgi:hypothetical protein
MKTTFDTFKAENHRMARENQALRSAELAARRECERQSYHVGAEDAAELGERVRESYLLRTLGYIPR